MNAPCAETSKTDGEPLRGECKVTPHLTFIRRRNTFVKRCRFVDRVRVVFRRDVFTTPTVTFSAETYGITVRARSGRKNHKTRARSVKGDTQRKHPRARTHTTTGNIGGTLQKAAGWGGVSASVRAWARLARIRTFFYTFNDVHNLDSCADGRKLRRRRRRAVSHQKCLGSGLNCPAALCEADRMVCKQAGAQ